MSRANPVSISLLALAASIGAVALGRAGRGAERSAFDGYALVGNQGFRIGLYDRDGSLRRSIRLSEPSQPRGVCLATDGDLYVAAWGSKGRNLFRLNRHGVETAAYSVLGPDRFAKTVAAAPDGDILLAFQSESRLVRFRPRTSAIVWDAPTGPLPRGIAVAGDGSIWVAAKGGNVRDAARGDDGRLVKHAPDGSILFEVPVPLGARGVAVDAEGNCWTAILGQQTGVAEDSANSADDRRVLKVSPDGKILFTSEVGLGPFAVACAADGSAFVSCSREESVHKLAPDGRPDARFGTGGRVDLRTLAPHPLSVGIDGEGDVWVASNYAGKAAEKRPVEIVRLDGATGAVRPPFPVRYPLAVRPETLGDPTGYALANVVDPAGDLDRDGARNRDELLAGKNPFDPASRP